YVCLVQNQNSKHYWMNVSGAHLILSKSGFGRMVLCLSDQFIKSAKKVRGVFKISTFIPNNSLKTAYGILNIK
ncbi:MAG: hypothetical protein V7749_11690, partial [Cocleimonas sp.]